MKIKLPKINWANWPTWAAYGVVFMGGFLSGGISATNPPAFMSGYVPPRPAVTVKEVKTAAVTVDRATVACTASLAATENLRKDIMEICKVVKTPAKAAAVAK